MPPAWSGAEIGAAVAPATVPQALRARSRPARHAASSTLARRSDRQRVPRTDPVGEPGADPLQPVYEQPGRAGPRYSMQGPRIASEFRWSSRLAERPEDLPAIRDGRTP